jgi:hypothetical protein
MGLLDRSINPAVTMRASGDPNMPQPLDLSRHRATRAEIRADQVLAEADAAEREPIATQQRTAAMATLTKLFRTNSPAGRPDLVKQLPELAKNVKDILRSGYEPDSLGGRMFTRLHKIQVWADANGNGDEVFNASNIAGPRSGRLTDTAPAFPLAESVESLSKEERQNLNAAIEYVGGLIDSFKGAADENEVFEALQTMDPADVELIQAVIGEFEPEELAAALDEAWDDDEDELLEAIDAADRSRLYAGRDGEALCEADAIQQFLEDIDEMSDEDAAAELDALNVVGRAKVERYLSQATNESELDELIDILDEMPDEKCKQALSELPEEVFEAISERVLDEEELAEGVTVNAPNPGRRIAVAAHNKFRTKSQIDLEPKTKEGQELYR